MNSTIEYIRRLNQSSVALKDEWLTRLRHVDAGPDVAVATPEIILTRESSIKGFDERQYETPVTVINQPPAEPATHAPSRQPVAEQPAPVSLPETSEPVEINNEIATDHEQPATPTGSINEASVVVEVHASAIQTNTDLSDLSSSELGTDIQAPVEGTRQVLENSTAHEDIVRPAIMPLRREPGTDELSAQPSEEEASAAAVESTTTSSLEDVIQRLEGTSGEAEYRELEAEADSDTLHYADDADTFVDDSEAGHSGREATNATRIEPAALAAWPTDRLGQRFIYAQSNKQKLIDSVVDQITGRFPPATCATIMLVGTGREIDVDSAVSRIATCMAGRELGNILLVDGNLPSRQMSSVLGLDQQAGVAELLGETAQLSSILCATDNSRLMILPAGREQVEGENINLQAASISNSYFKQQFDYTIIGGGCAGDSLTDSWASMVDGVYLLVDVDESDRERTREIVDYFRNIGTRIVGCIATRS